MATPSRGDKVRVACKACRDASDQNIWMRRGNGISIGRMNRVELDCPRCGRKVPAHNGPALCFLDRIEPGEVPTCFTTM